MNCLVDGRWMTETFGLIDSVCFGSGTWVLDGLNVNHCAFAATGRFRLPLQEIIKHTNTQTHTPTTPFNHYSEFSNVHHIFWLCLSSSSFVCAPLCVTLQCCSLHVHQRHLSNHASKCKHICTLSSTCFAAPYQHSKNTVHAIPRHPISRPTVCICACFVCPSFHLLLPAPHSSTRVLTGVILHLLAVCPEADILYQCTHINI